MDTSEPDPAKIEDYRQRIELLGEQTMKFGLHLQGAMAMPDPTDPSELVMVASFLPGDLAWSDRVQKPEVHHIDEEFRSLVRETEEDKLENYRRKLMGEG